MAEPELRLQSRSAAALWLSSSSAVAENPFHLLPFISQRLKLGSSKFVCCKTTFAYLLNNFVAGVYVEGEMTMMLAFKVQIRDL